MNRYVIVEVERRYGIMEKYLSAQAVAEMLSVDIKTIYRMIDAGELEAIKVRNRLRISEESVKAFIEQNRVAVEA